MKTIWIKPKLTRCQILGLAACLFYGLSAGMRRLADLILTDWKCHK